MLKCSSFGVGFLPLISSSDERSWTELDLIRPDKWWGQLGRRCYRSLSSVQSTGSKLIIDAGCTNTKRKLGLRWPCTSLTLFSRPRRLHARTITVTLTSLSSPSAGSCLYPTRKQCGILAWIRHSATHRDSFRTIFKPRGFGLWHQQYSNNQCCPRNQCNAMRLICHYPDLVDMPTTSGHYANFKIIFPKFSKYCSESERDSTHATDINQKNFINEINLTNGLHGNKNEINSECENWWA